MHFNPRSRKESDRTYSQHGVNASGFQSTLSQGERHPDNLPPDGRVHISIHALARRATIAFCQLLSARGDFNPRSRKESDPHEIAKIDSDIEISIHALARRATTLVARKGVFTVISIHALARRATHLQSTRRQRRSISIHALARRATSRPQGRVSAIYISIHALARRATLLARL